VRVGWEEVFGTWTLLSLLLRFTTVRAVDGMSWESSSGESLSRGVATCATSPIVSSSSTGLAACRDDLDLTGEYILEPTLRFLPDPGDGGIGADTYANDMAALRSSSSFFFFFCRRSCAAEGFSQLSCSTKCAGCSPNVRFRLSCDSFIETYSALGSLEERMMGSVRGVSSRIALIGLESAGIGLECRA
jgi:hypothetical protein